MEALSPDGERRSPTFKPLHIKVVTHNIATGEVHRECVVDYNSQDKRDWLHRLTIWAVFNHYAVEVFNVQDDDKK
jgi:hypothetical protein